MSFSELREFNETFGVAIRENPAVRVREARLRYRLIEEETQELLDAVKDCDIVETLDALADIMYVIQGAILTFGIEELVNILLEEHGSEYDESVIGRNNPLLSVEGREIMLEDLRTSILRNRPNEVGVVLTTFILLVDDLADYFDLDVEAAVTAVHRSNMTKLDENGKVIRRESDLKIMKSELYRTPTADLEYQLFGEEEDARVS